MKDSITDNKRIAKNTLLLYGRMLYSLIISLFTARVIINALGFEDYGLYNVIGSIVSMFVFLRSAMGNSVNRYITFAIGKGDEQNLNKIFSMSLMIFMGLAIIVLLLSETVGLWFLNSKIEIPYGREAAANWVFQFSIFSCVLSIICVPYDAEIIAHEKMGIFAIIQALNSTLNLAIVYAVKYFSHDKLIFYAFLLFLVQVMNRIIYGIYCGKHFKETKFRWVNDTDLLKEMFGFAGWSLIGNLAYIGYTQGLNIVLNMFFGTVVNAARGIAVSVQGAIKGFVSNFQIAVNPQITKSYARGDFDRLHNLIYTSSKLSFYLLYCFVLPIIIESKTILHFWLGEVPDYAEIFTILTLVIMLLDPLSNPIGIANNATGKIRTYQIVEGGSLLMILPIAYIALRLGGNPVSVFIVQLLVLTIVQILRLFLVCHKIQMSIREYVIKIIVRVSGVAILASVLPILLYLLLQDNLLNAVLIIVVSIISVIVCSYLIGINSAERSMINQKILMFVMKFRKQ